MSAWRGAGGGFLILSLGLVSSEFAFGVVNRPAVKADNTQINARDRDNATLTAEDQIRGSRTDVELTRKIRHELVGDKTLSAYAHNIKIITLDGVVTLRGPVTSQKERTEVGRLARSLPGVKKVHNHLEVSSDVH